MDVFISYSSKEYEDAFQISSVLRKNGISTWLAPDSIPGGSNYTKEIPHAIKNCKALLLVLSNNAQDSIWVSAEVETAFKNGKIIIPFLIENCPMKDDFDFLLSRSQRITAYEKKADALNTLVRRVKSIVGVEDKQTAADDVKETKNQVCGRNNPHIFAPLLFLSYSHYATSTVITVAGHSLAQRPHPTHFDVSTKAKIPWGREIASLGQTFAQEPQATQSLRSTTAFFLAIFIPHIFYLHGYYTSAKKIVL